MPFTHDENTATPASRNPALDAASPSRAALRGASYASGQVQLKPGDKKPHSSIVHIGMGDHAGYEARKLNSMAPEGVKSIRQREKEQDQIRTGGVLYDLSSDQGLTDFVKTLGVPQAKQDELAQILRDTGGGARDEVAQILQVFGQAEVGLRVMQRVVLSGHSVGTSIWGDTNGDLEFDILKRISAAFPKAAAQVEDLMLSACYSGGESTMDQYFVLFPGVKTIWAYHDSSPGSHSGAMTHMQRWERASRGHDPSRVKKSLADNSRKGKNVSVWTETGGYDGAERKPVGDLMGAVTAGQAMYQEYFSGTREVENTQSGPLRQHYNAIQSALAHPQIVGAEREQLERQRDVTIRLIFFKIVREKFMAKHKATIQAAYATTGLSMPDYAKMGRGAAVGAVSAFEAAGGSGQAKILLKEGLIGLSSTHVPSNWV